MLFPKTTENIEKKNIEKKNRVLYDFYNENNILIYSEPIDLNSPFFKNEYEELSDEMYEKYSLKNWLITMIGKET